MYRIGGLQLGPRLTVEKMHASAVFNEKYLRSYGCSGTNFTATFSCRDLKLKNKLKPSKGKSLEYRSTLQ